MLRPVTIALAYELALTSADCIPEETFDYVVVGLGAGGSIAASRLASMGHSVIGIEAGPPLQAANGGTMFAGTFEDGAPFTIYDVPALNPFPPAPKEHLWDVGSWEKGGHTKGIGGDGARNGFLYLRAVPEDFEELVNKYGLQGWAYDDVLPFLSRTETNTGRSSGPHRGKDGPITIVDAATSEWDDMLFEACKTRGMNVSDDFNAPHGRFGCGVMQWNMKNGVRDSSAAAFLPHAQKKDGLVVLADSLVTKVVFQGLPGSPRAVGVEVQKICNGVEHKQVVHVSKEVILSGGTLNTPRLLMLSGIGPRDQLSKFDVPVVVDSCVGCSLRNHYTVFLSYKTRQPWLYADPTASYLEYVQNHTGYYTRTHGGAEGAVLIWLKSPYSSKPDIQLRFFPYWDDNVHHVRFNMDLDSPTSPPGSFNLTSGSYDGTPPVYGLPKVSTEDAKKFVWAIGEIRKLAATPSLVQLLEAEFDPAPTDETELMDWVIGKAAPCTGHWMGTTPMGEVLTEDLRVKGVDALRVADNSVWPFQLNGNTQAHAWLAGERAADFATAGSQLIA